MTRGFFSFVIFKVCCSLWHVDFVPFGCLDLYHTKAHYSWARSYPVSSDKLRKGEAAQSGAGGEFLCISCVEDRYSVCFTLKYFRTRNKNYYIASYKI